MALEHDRTAQRGEEILAVLGTASGDLRAPGPDALRARFRKLAASVLAFHRATPGLFYADPEHGKEGYGIGPFLDERTGSIWIHGDLHTGRFGASMDATGRLVFGAAGFDEAYVGPFTWDLKRFAASLALQGRVTALGDEQISGLVRRYAAAYRERIHTLAAGARHEEVPALTLDNAEGPVLGTLRRARAMTRSGMLAGRTRIRDFDRRFRSGEDTVELDAATRYTILAAFDGYLESLPDTALARPDSYRVKDVVGRRNGAGPTAHDILLEGGSDALEDDVVISMRPGRTPAVSRHLADRPLREHVRHEGHRTVLARRALQAHADPWLGWTELDGTGQLVAEVSPYEVALDWPEAAGPEELDALVADLGRATADLHAAAGDGSGRTVVPFAAERAVDAAVAADEDGFPEFLTDFAHHSAARAVADHRIFVDLLRKGRIPGA
ncbi:DUF2252 family protein [Streptomyces morookaense]|uniref:DUF2252 family protein n=1 Tax=Streptomyces morookaense TaxID=1970 RepID=UPI0033D01585